MIKETIVVASNISHSEKIKSLASFGKKTFNTRYMSTYELAQYLLERSGVVIDKEFITNDLLVASIYQEVKTSINYYKDFSYNDLLGLLNSVNDLRHYIVNDEEKEIIKGLRDHPEFVVKNEAIISFYETLKGYMAKNNLIDELGIIRFAYENTSEFKNIDFVINEDDQLTSYCLDMALINKASGYKVKTNSFGKTVKIESYTKAFSQVNEIEHIIDYINKHDIPFNECLIVGAETKDYSAILENYKDLLSLPLTLGIGKNVINTNPGKLYSLLCDYEKSGYHTEYLRTIIHDYSFKKKEFIDYLNIPSDNFEAINKTINYPESISLDSIITTVGDLRLSFNKTVNEQRFKAYETLLNDYRINKVNEDETSRRLIELDYVRSFKDLLNKGLSFFIDTYARVNDIFDANALAKVLKCISFMTEHNVNKKDIDKVIFNQPIGRHPIENDKLYFVSINRASSVLRKHLFIVGLSSSNYPGNNKEDPNLLDRDYTAFKVNNASSRAIENNRNIYFSLIKEATALGASIHLSYAYYNSITLKMQNASSVIFETYKLENGSTKTIKDLENSFEDVKKTKYTDVDYFSTNLLAVKDIGAAIKENKEEVHSSYVFKDPIPQVQLDTRFYHRPLSASNIVNYTECEYKFFLSYVLKISQPEEIDLYSIIPPNHLGTMVHSLLEDLDKNVVDKASFLTLASKRFDEYFIIHHTDNDVLLNKNKQEFLSIMDNAYELDDGSLTVLKETYLKCQETKSKLWIHGMADKVIKKGNDYIAIDYKTNRSIKHKLEEPETLIQCILYCYVLNKVKKLPMKRFIFRYLRLKEDITSDKDINEYYKVLEDVLARIKNSFDIGEFKPNYEKCEKCYFRNVCQRGQ